MRVSAISAATILLCAGVLVLLADPGASSQPADRRRAGTTQPFPDPPRLFYGRVVDQDGAVVPDAEIVVSRARLVRSVDTGTTREDLQTKQTFSVYSGVTGSFAVMLPTPLHVVTIEKVKKDDYDWVFDWAWTLGVSPHVDGNNRHFILSGELATCRFYQPDRDRPAVYPLHRVGVARPASRPSRGGSEHHCDGTIVVNEPVALKVPSAGAGAPRGEAEMDKAISLYLERFRDAAATRPAGKKP
jgi:hypothetical protein